jgi:uracil-DNA glycosylase
MTEDRLRLEASWKAVLRQEFDEPYMQKLRTFLAAEKQAGKKIFPPGAEMFAALDSTPLDSVKVVIIGQDPYHGPGQAHGLCFSVRSGVPIPPSLANIFQEIMAEYPDEARRFDGSHGCLEPWARQGVLLLNAVLSVERGRAGSHHGRGWETFTDAIVQRLNEEREHLVFLLWGSYAQKKGAKLDRQKHCVLSAPHPSPLSAHRGFFGCNHFREANAYLVSQGLEPIDWFEVA